MKMYIGFKGIKAKPVTLGEYNKIRGWDIPDSEDFKKEGYLVEYYLSEGEKPNCEGYEGYISWSPKDVFEQAYFEVNNDITPHMSIFNYFKFDHLPTHLQKVSRPLCMLANVMKDIMPDSAEKTVGMRKLLEAKDCFVRAFLSNAK